MDSGLGEVGSNQHTGGYTLEYTLPNKSSTDYLVARIARNRPDIWERMKRGEFESVAAAAREVVNQLARQAARKRMGRSALDENFGEVIKAVYVEHKQRCGLRWQDGASLKDLDVEQLRKLADSIRREIEG